MKKISSNPSAPPTINPQIKNTNNNPIAHTEQHNHAGNSELELLAQLAFERSYYYHLAYSTY
ncbi:MAG: hypothetical protein KME52_32080 [Desmonostoc geniculatum HA4340-LM1]|jgi:hypothetical protein|nr:hypothetical protein [Goleter apudmare HA4340-LM2]MBW4678450.1 hypothetical protein [Desmonostoc geniculatum HA4340-LM1]